MTNIEDKLKEIQEQIENVKEKAKGRDMDKSLKQVTKLINQLEKTIANNIKDSIGKGSSIVNAGSNINGSIISMINGSNISVINGEVIIDGEHVIKESKYKGLESQVEDLQDQLKNLQSKLKIIDEPIDVQSRYSSTKNENFLKLYKLADVFDVEATVSSSDLRKHSGGEIWHLYEQFRENAKTIATEKKYHRVYSDENWDVNNKGNKYTVRATCEFYTKK